MRIDEAPLGEPLYVPPVWVCPRGDLHQKVHLQYPCPQCTPIRPEELTRRMTTLTIVQYAVLAIAHRQEVVQINPMTVEMIKYYIASVMHRRTGPTNEIVVAVAVGRLQERGLLTGGRSPLDDRLMDWKVTEEGLTYLDPNFY